VRRYWRVYRTFFVSSFARELEFRANFFAKVAQNCVWVGFFVLVLLVVYRNTETVAGWGRGQALVLAATVFLMTAFHSALFFSLYEIPEAVRKGTLDYVLTKPVDSQFWISTRRFNFDRLGSLLAGCGMVVIGITTADLSPSPGQWAAYTATLLASLAIFYSINLMMMTLGVWFVRVDNLWVLSETVLDVARFPIDIFPLPLQRFFLFALPMAFLATIPARQLVFSLDLPMVAFSWLWAVALLLASRAFWRLSTRNYASASS
jgi:ABC-2 type transport system permease protein